MFSAASLADASLVHFKTPVPPEHQQINKLANQLIN